MCGSKSRDSSTCRLKRKAAHSALATPITTSRLRLRRRRHAGGQPTHVRRDGKGMCVERQRKGSFPPLPIPLRPNLFRVVCHDHGTDMPGSGHLQDPAYKPILLSAAAPPQHHSHSTRFTTVGQLYCLTIKLTSTNVSVRPFGSPLLDPGVISGSASLASPLCVLLPSVMRQSQPHPHEPTSSPNSVQSPDVLRPRSMSTPRRGVPGAPHSGRPPLGPLLSGGRRLLAYFALRSFGAFCRPWCRCAVPGGGIFRLRGDELAEDGPAEDELCFIVLGCSRVGGTLTHDRRGP